MRIREHSRDTSTNTELTYRLRYEAFRALGPTARGKIVSASTLAEANHMFVKYFMAKCVHTLDAA